jgi:hypothetical protein
MKWWYIESVDINNITDKEITLMYQIERDTWGHFMWEYVKCTNNNCKMIFSKKDIYSSLDIGYNKKTVWELEKRFWEENIKCSCCWWKTEFIRWEELKNIIKSRIFWTKESFVNFYKSSVDEILWFSYWFIDTAENIYKNEFSLHFDKGLLNIFDNKFWNNDLINLSWVCLIEREKNIKIIYELLKNFYCNLEPKYDNLIWIWESIKWTPSYKIYKKIWLKSLNENSNVEDTKLNKCIDSDILYGDKLVKTVKSICEMNLLDFLEYTKKNIK